jgi:Methyltransferase domain
MRPGGGPAVERTRELIERLFREKTVVARSDGSRHSLFPLSVDIREGEALREWVKREGVAHTLEIGFGYGISALFICEGLLANGRSHARHVVLDPNESSRFADCGLQIVKEAGLADLVEFHAEASEIALPRFLAKGRHFDLAFVDGNHRFDRVFLDLIYLGGSSVRAGSCSLTITSFPRSRGRRPSAQPISPGRWKKSHATIASTIGRSCGRRLFRSSGRSITTSTSECEAGETALALFRAAAAVAVYRNARAQAEQRSSAGCRANSKPRSPQGLSLSTTRSFGK